MNLPVMQKERSKDSAPLSLSLSPVCAVIEDDKKRLALSLSLTHFLIFHLALQVSGRDQA